MSNMESLVINKIVDVANSLPIDDQEKVLAHAKKILAARRIEAAYPKDFTPIEISDEDILSEIKAYRDEKRNKKTGN
ncbi:MAG TPA: hypothetical protein VK872_16360 [Draconibacterium sp.]|jgi:hypothetical protein|nr:hypothetical protein [Draconibacterium sp.]